MNPSIHAAHGGYSRAQIALHWLSVALMCSLVLAGELRHLLVEHADMRMRPIMIVHIGSGMALLVVMLMRSALRAGRAKPIGATTLQQWCAHIVHLAMYVFVLGECLAGWVIVNAKGLVIPMPGTGWDFPRLVDADPQLVRYMVQAHEWLGFLLYALLAAHIGAALWHHWSSGRHAGPHGPSGLAPGAARTALAERVLSDAPGAGARGFAQIRNSGRIRSRLDSG